VSPDRSASLDEFERRREANDLLQEAKCFSRTVTMNDERTVERAISAKPPRAARELESAVVQILAAAPHARRARIPNQSIPFSLNLNNVFLVRGLRFI